MRYLLPICWRSHCSPYTCRHSRDNYLWRSQCTWFDTLTLSMTVKDVDYVDESWQASLLSQRADVCQNMRFYVLPFVVGVFREGCYVLAASWDDTVGTGAESDSQIKFSLQRRLVTNLHKCLRAHTHTYTHTHAYAQATHTHTQRTQIHTRTHVCTHIYTYTHTHTHTYTRKHIHLHIHSLSSHEATASRLCDTHNKSDYGRCETVLDSGNAV